MNIGSKIWERKSCDINIVNHIYEHSGLSRVTAQVLANRGLKTLEEINGFLNPDLNDLYNPFLLKGMREAVDRVLEAINKNESIWIYGDYDVDGITSISIMIKVFEALNYPVNYYIPNRLEEGYGISQKGIDRIKEAKGHLIVSVDCGITAVKEVEYAKSLGLDFIISDHHECQTQIPDAIAVINPKQHDCNYPFDMLAGAGVAFKMAQGLIPDLNNKQELLKELLSICALGTVADIAPVNNENRIIVKHGMAYMLNTTNLGLKKLMETSGIKEKKITTGDIGFKLGPRINATGRVGEPALGVKLLMTTSESEAEAIANKLSTLNEERQKIEKTILEEAINIIESEPSFKDEKILILGKEGWHTGIIGIVASKLCEKYYKPIILLRIEDGIMKGSARSISEFSIFEGLNYAQDLLDGYGGHELAAGLSLKLENFNEFKKMMLVYANEHLSEFDMISKLKVDVELLSKDVNYQLLDDIEKLEPFGIGNPKPTFVYKNLIVDQKRKMGKNQEHIRLHTHDGNRVFESVGFYMDIPDSVHTGDTIDLAFQVDRNDFGGVTSLQFILKDYRLLKEIVNENDLMNQYYGSLANSLHDSMDDFEKKPHFYIDFRSKSVKEKIVVNLSDDSRKTLILIHSPVGLQEIIRLSLDFSRKEWLDNIYFNCLPPQVLANVTILINPKYSQLDLSALDQVILYDMPHSQNYFDHLLNTCKNVTVLYNKNDDLQMKSVINHSIPDRNDLANIYLSIKNGIFVEHELILTKGIAYRPKLEFSLKILETLKLIYKTEPNGLYQLIESDNKKINLFDTEIYQSIQDINLQFENFSKVAHKK